MDNYEQAKKLFTHLWRGGQWAMFWVNPGKISYWFTVDALPTAIKPGFSRNLYFGVNPCAVIPPTNARNEPRPPAEVRAQLAQIAALNCLFAEFDTPAGGDKLEVLTHIRLLTPAPTVIIDSGGGYHCYWLLDKPLMLTDADTREYARSLEKRWVAFVKGDKGAADLARVLRVPGSRNWKPEYAPEFPEVAFVRWLNMEYSLHQLTGMLPAEPSRTQYQAQGAKTGDVLDIAQAMITRAVVGEKHTVLLKAARLVGGYIAGGAMDYATAFSAMIDIVTATPGWERSGHDEKTIIDGFEYGAAAPLEVK